MTGPVYRFGEYRVDSGRFELLRDGQSIRVERKPLELLILLASHQGHLVTRSEIAQRLWDSEVFVDTEHGINTAIRKIRQVLGDDSEEPRFVQTVTGKGYRILCPVEVSNGQTDVHASVIIDDPVPKLQPVESRRRSKRLLPTIAFVTALVICLTFASLYLRRPLPLLRVTEFNPITHDGHPKSIVGTDGSRIYFNFNRFIFTGRIGQVAVSGGEIAPVQVPLPAPALLDVSPDGSSLLVLSSNHGQSSLWSMQVPGGSIRHLADSAVWSAALAPDGGSVVYSTPDNEIFVVKSDGTGAHRLATAEGEAKSPTDSFAWSPDGSGIRFFRDNKLWEISADGTGLHQPHPGWRPSAIPCCSRWTPDGKFFLFELQEALPNQLLPGNQLWALDERRSQFRRVQSEPIQLTSGAMRWSTPVPSKDGKRVFARGIVLRGELVRYDAQSHQLQPWLGGISAEAVAYSPNGNSIAYVTFPEGILWMANRDGSKPIQLTGPPMYPFNPHWSPDGTQILFYSFEGGSKIRSYIVASQGGTPQLLLPEDKEQQIDPYWSPDGHKVVFGWPKLEPGNTNNVLRVLDLKSHQVVTLPGSQGMWSPRWSPNGRFIAALNASGGISVYDFEKQQWSELHKGETNFPTFSSDSRFIYFLSTLNTPPGVYRVRVTGGYAERIVDLRGFRFTGAVSFWMGLDPTDTPTLLRDVGTDDIYALTLDH